MGLTGILLFILSLLILVVIYIVFFKKKLPKILVSFSELVGNEIIEHPTPYVGTLNYDKDIMRIGKLNIVRPIPPQKVIKSCNNGQKKIFLIQIGINRYAYRIPSQNNQIFTFKRDDNNNIIKDDKTGKPKIEKFKWRYADNVLEQEDVHWMTHMRKELDEKHKAMEGALTKWVGPMSMVLIFVFGLAYGNMYLKEFRADKEAIMERSDRMQQDAAATVGMVNKLLERTTGERIINTEAQRKK